MPMDEVTKLKIFAEVPELLSPKRRREVEEDMWGVFGQMVGQRIFDPEFVHVVTRAALKAKTTLEHTAMIRAFLLTGARP